ncbi:MAG: 1-deoxy-D-xylulose-5-phosphate reductoisomerase [Coraliomargaritaceae bacterium]
MAEEQQKNIVLLGATGSIGQSTLRVLRAHPDRLRLIAVSARSNGNELAKICDEFSVPYAALTESPVTSVEFPKDTQLLQGESSLLELATLEAADIVVVATVGAHALRPTMAAIEAGKDIALANKELLVLGGSLVMDAAKEKKIRLLPIDSEHNAIFQCLEGHSTQQVGQLILTASGGQFRDRPIEALKKVRPEDATQHPNWSMGRKITVDSSTMANKGLELIEAHWLFGIEADRLSVVVHPQSLAHSFVQFVDGCILGQFSPPSMTFSIQHCLLYPDRQPGVEPTIDFSQPLQLDFSAPDLERYPCLRMAYDCLNAGGGAAAVFNAANEVAVQRFLDEKIAYLDIPRIIERALGRFASEAASETIEGRLILDRETRSFCNKLQL